MEVDGVSFSSTKENRLQKQLELFLRLTVKGVLFETVYVSQNCFKRFKSGDFDVSDKQTNDLQVLLHVNPEQSSCELARQLEVGHSTVKRRLNNEKRNYLRADIVH